MSEQKEPFSAEKPSLKRDWERVKNAFIKAVKDYGVPFAVEPQELRKADNRGVDFALRRLLESGEYDKRLRLYGVPTDLYPRNPFVTSDGKRWALIRVKLEAQKQK